MADSPQSPTARPSGRVADSAAAGAAPTLMVLHPEPDSGRGVPLSDSAVVIGRDSACDLVLSSPQVSRRHASMRSSGGGFELTDLDSSNGTWLNEVRLAGPVVIGIGARFRVGDVELTIAASTLPTQRAQAQPLPSSHWDPAQPTEPDGQAASDRRRSLAREVSASNGFSASALGLAILGSMVGMILTTRIDLGPLGPWAGAALGPILSATFTTRRAGERGRVRLAVMGALSALALVITVFGVALTPPEVRKPLVGDYNPAGPIVSELSETGGFAGDDRTGGPDPPPPPEGLSTQLAGGTTATDGQVAPWQVTLSWQPSPGTNQAIKYKVTSDPPRSPVPTDSDPTDLSYADTVPADYDGRIRYQVVTTDTLSVLAEYCVSFGVPETGGEPVPEEVECP